MGDLHSTKCIIYANFYIINLKKILTYNPNRSAGCVIEEHYKNTIAVQLFQLFSCSIFLSIFTFHATCVNYPASLTWNIFFTEVDIETKMDLVMANMLEI